MKKHLLAACISLCMLTSCYTTYYQVYKVAPENARLTQNGSPIFVTDDGLEFTYNLWGEAGNLRFIVHNTNDYDIIVDLTRSSFIRNNIAEDYYQGKQIENRVATAVYNSSEHGVSSSISVLAGSRDAHNYLGKSYDIALAISSIRNNTNYVQGKSIKKEWQSAILYNEPEIIRIPANSAKVVYSFDINSQRIVDSKLSAELDYNPIMFTKETSPLIMRNRICAYKEGEEPLYHDMSFYISSIENVQDLSGLFSPTTFYVSYSSKDENVKSVYSLITEETNNSNNKIKGIAVDYKGISGIIISQSNDYVTIIANEGKIGTWQEALDYNKTLTDGWHVPSSEEIMKFAFSKFLQQSYKYWTIDEVNEKRAKYFDKDYHDVYTGNKIKTLYIVPIVTVPIQVVSELVK